MRIYHNPACGTSRTVLARLRENGIEPQILEYLKTPPDVAELRSLLKQLGLEARDLLRRKGTTLETLGFVEADMSGDAILEAIARHPILLERPIVAQDGVARICRPADRVETFLG